MSTRPLATVALFLAILSAGTGDALACGSSRTAEAQGERGPGQRGALVVGDSTMLLATPLLGRRGITADARGCRQFAEGLALIRRRLRAKTLPHLVVLALGTNGRITSGQIERVLDVIGPRRVLGLLTPRNHGATQTVMRRTARRLPLRILLMDWRRFSDRRAGWFAPDGLHPTHAGALGLARYIAGRAAQVTRPPVASLRLPKGVAGTKGCGLEARGGSRFAVRVVRGGSRITCARARRLVARPPLAGIDGWSWWDWRPAPGIWLEVYRRADRRIVVATTPVPAGAQPSGASTPPDPSGCAGAAGDPPAAGHAAACAAKSAARAR